jgi:hypothetical protein
MRERRSKRRRVGPARKSPALVDAKAFLLDAAQAVPNEIRIALLSYPG